MNALIIVQARTGSSRLPEKILKPFFNGQTLLEVQLSKLVDAFGLDRVVIATSNSTADDQLAHWLSENNYQVYRGSEDDLVERFIGASREHKGVEHLVRVCADNPFLRTEYIEKLLEHVDNSGLNYVSFQHCDGTPSILGHSGLFAEMVQVNTLEKIVVATADLENRALFREHPTLFILQNRDQFQLRFIEVDSSIDDGDPIRLTVDTLADFELSQRLYSKLVKEYGVGFSVAALLETVRADPNNGQQMANNILKNSK